MVIIWIYIGNCCSLWHKSSNILKVCDVSEICQNHANNNHNQNVFLTYHCLLCAITLAAHGIEWTRLERPIVTDFNIQADFYFNTTSVRIFWTNYCLAKLVLNSANTLRDVFIRNILFFLQPFESKCYCNKRGDILLCGEAQKVQHV